MAELNNLPNPKMDWDSTDRSIALAEFKQLCQLWFTANETPDERQYSYILLWSGSKRIKLSNTWGLSAEQLQDPKNVWDKFAESEPQDNFRIHRLELQKFRQQTGESVNDFVTRCKTKVMKCKLSDDKARDERIIEQIISGIKYTEAQRKLLAKDEKMTLKQAIDICRNFEASVSHMEKMTNIDKPTSAVDFVSQRDLKSKLCGNCGLKHEFKRCPAFNTKCDVCGKMNHWRKCCRSKPTDSARQQPPQRGRGDQHAHGYPYKRRRSHTPHRRHDVVTSEVDSDIDIADDMNNLQFQPINFSTVDTTDDRTEVYANLNIMLNSSTQASLKVKVDTGAQGNILPLRIFRRMYPRQLDEDRYPKAGSTTQKKKPY